MAVEYTNSGLVNKDSIVLATPGNYGSRPKDQKIDLIAIHCVAGHSTDGKSICTLNFQSNRQISSNYGIGDNGNICLFVEEKNRSFCTSSSHIDGRGVSIEVSSDAQNPCNITAEAMESLIKLCADICKRNGIPKLLWKGDRSLLTFSGGTVTDVDVSKQNIVVHRWTAQKACPGDYIYNNLTDIANRVNKLLDNGYVNPPVTIVDSSYYGPPSTRPNPGSSSGNSGSSSSSSSKNYSPYDDATKAKLIKQLRSAGYVSELRQKIQKVDNYIKKHDTTAFIKFSVNGFELDTSKATTFEQYAISLENQKTGAGQGNQFKLKIAYHKHFSNYSDINMLEQALGPMRNASMLNYASNNMNSVRNDLLRNACILQYGYLTQDQTLISPEYTGLLLKYSVNANKQIVEYTLEGFTGEQALYDTVNWYPNIADMDMVQTSDGKTVPRAVLSLKSSNNKLSDSELEDLINKLNQEYSGGLTFNPFYALDCFLQDYNNSVSSNSMKFYLIDCTNGHRNLNLWKDADALEPVRMSICKGQTPLQYIEYCVGLFKYKETSYAMQFLQQQNRTSERFVYSFALDPDDNTKTYVCIDIIDSTNPNPAYEFIGYTPENSLMIDYNLNYDGTVALAVANSINDETNNAIYIDKDGAIRQKTSITRDMFVAGQADEVLIAKQNTWLDKISCANNCSMTTFGLPFEIPVGTVFNCGLYITDTKHHSSGNCFVTGIVDNINNNNFTTKFTMIRLPGAETSINNYYG